MKIEEIRRRLSTLGPSRGPARFLKTDEVEDGTVVEILDEGRLLEKSRDGRSGFGITVRLPNGQERVWAISLMALEKLAETLGDDTSRWVGKKVRLVKVPRALWGRKGASLIAIPLTQSGGSQK